MKSLFRWLLLLAAATQFILTALPPGNGDIIGVQSAALDLSNGEKDYLYPGKGFSRNDEWVEHSARNHLILGDRGEPQWLMYPPLYVWLLSPLASLGAEPWRLGWAVLQFGVLFLFLLIIDKWLRLIGVKPDRILIAALLLGSYPIARVFQLGQTSMMLSLLLWASLYAWERGHRVWAPMGLGCAVFIKPFLFIVEISCGLDRRWNRAVGTFAVLFTLTLGSILFVGWSAQIEYIQFLRTLSGSQTAFWGNQSLLAGILRIFSELPAMWYGFEQDDVLRVVAICVLVVMLSSAVLIQFRSTRRYPMATPALWLNAVLLGLSLSWEHHVILLLPAVAFLWSKDLSRMGLALLVLATLLISVNITPLYDESYVGRALASLPALGRLILFTLFAAIHFDGKRFFKTAIA